MNAADFEQQLKQMRPVNCDDQLAETFYQSGWQACEKSRAAVGATRSFNRTVPTFVTGLACGVLFSVAAFLFAPNADVPVGVNVAQRQPGLPNQEADRPAVDLQQTTESFTAGVDQAEPEMMAAAEPWKAKPWKIDDLFLTSPLALEKPSPLSRIARLGWSSQIQASQKFARQSSLAAVTSQDTQKEAQTPSPQSSSPLTASPFNRRIFDELML